MQSAKRILVCGAGGSAGINFIRSLRLADEPFYIVAADMNRWHLELPDADAVYALPQCLAPDYLETLNRVVERERIDLVHAQPDMEVEVLSANRKRLAARTWLPAHSGLLVCRDKVATNRVLSQAGVAIPVSYKVERLKDLPRLLDELQARHELAWVRMVRGAGSRGALPVRTGRQAGAWIRYWRHMRPLESMDFMICEFLPGREFAFQSVWKDGEIVTSQARERLEYCFGNLMPSGQSSTPSVARTVHDPRVNELCTRAVRAIDANATGVFCVDVKENVDGLPCVTEINAGRFFTTSDFFAQLGANMPHTYVKLALGEDPGPLPQYNATEAGLYWVRILDGGPRLVREDEWRAREP